MLRGGQDEISSQTDSRLTINAMERITNNTWVCGKLFKNQHGLKVHQARMKWLEWGSEVQRTGPELGETQEEPGQEAPHRAQSLHAPESSNPNRVVPQQWIK